MAAPTVAGAAQSNLLRDLSPEERAEVLSAARSRSIQVGGCLFHQGDLVEALFVVDSGRLRLAQNTADGEEVIVRSVGAGEIVAGVALLGQRSLPVTATAEVATRVLAWPIATIQELAQKYPALRSNVLATIADRMQESLSRIRELSSEDVAQRIARTLLRLARERGKPHKEGVQIDQDLGRKHLADLAGTSMFTASRLLAAWARDGVLEVGRQRVAILDLERLARIAEGDAGRS